MDWLSQLFPCLSVRRVHDSPDDPDALAEVRSIAERHFAEERRYAAERRPSIESWLSIETDYLETGRTVGSPRLAVPPPRGRQETLYWLDNGNDAGVIAARDAADRNIRESFSSGASNFSHVTAAMVRLERDFDKDENGLPLFTVGSPGSAGTSASNFSSAPPTKETPSRRREPFPQDLPSLDITSSTHLPPSSTVSSPSHGNRPNGWRRLDLPYTGATWPFGVGYESFSERINALNLTVPKKDQVAEENSYWKLGEVNSRRPVLHIDTRFEGPVVQPRAAFVGSPSENDQANALPGLSPSVSPSDYGSYKEDSRKLPTVIAITPKLEGLTNDSSLNSHVESPTTPVNDSGFGNITGDDDSKYDVHPKFPSMESHVIEAPTTESRTVNKLADGGRINSNASVDSPACVDDHPIIKELIHNIDLSIDSISASRNKLTSAPEADKLANYSNSRSEVCLETSPPSLMANVV
ncbi:hypothetical protein N0V84_007262 [Fusarium piperis]|uniref:Uncharacterized protein n=1 Tax=Fusarium piperis TaxID=1435070 RepID=A0A9W8WA93_9HYPO|nr:hypothetical protein N0V84_007262 [Fusarium piperis]